jgi:3-mercaptopyruvate sulfurtransferase SseA
VAQFLRQQGRQAWALRGGLAAWRAARLPMEGKAVTPAPAADEECPDCHEEVAEHTA